LDYPSSMNGITPQESESLVYQPQRKCQLLQPAKVTKSKISTFHSRSLIKIVKYTPHTTTMRLALTMALTMSEIAVSESSTMVGIEGRDGAVPSSWSSESTFVGIVPAALKAGTRLIGCCFAVP
jgi:hypothetical protein